MAILKIRYLPDPVLRQIAKPVTSIDDKLTSLIADMFDTMYDAKGVGLAAPQVGVSLRLFVVDVEGEKSKQMVFINPELINAEGETEYQEGCLSVPSVYDNVKRATTVTVKAQNQTGEWFEITASELLGECLQHEIDHLNGKLFIDLLSPTKRQIARRKLDKYKRSQKNKS